MKTSKLPSLLNLPVQWTDEDWAKPLVVQKPRCSVGRMMKSAVLPHQCARSFRRRSAFTLIELLVVIAIIALLAALLFPVLGRVKLRAKIASAKTDMNNIASAVAAYQAAYTVAPVPKDLPPGVDNAQDYSFSITNTDIIVILMDVDQYANLNHRRNPEKHAFLNPGTLKQGTSSPGVSLTDYNYRDPWGNPYIFAFDLNYDNKVTIPNSGANADPNFSPYPYTGVPPGSGIPRGLLIWSMGPDGKAAPFADPQGYNKDNIRNWE